MVATLGPRGVQHTTGSRRKDMLARIRTMKTQKREEGASAVEYALLVAAIAALIVIVVFAFGGLIKDIFSDTCTTIDNNTTSSASGSCA